MPPKSKKRRLNNAAKPSSSPAPLTPDRESWPGWCEIESEPAFFNTMLHEIGVRGVRTQEVFGLDETSLAILPQPVHAMIFLFRYQKDGTAEEQENSCPSHVWFANQIPENACGTVALLNIINNIPNLELGQQLQSFKDFTQSFDPIARGKAIDSFDFVRKIHNSFARDVDMLIVDSAMKEKHTKAMKKQKQDAANASRAAKAAERAAGKAAERALKPGHDPSSLRSNPPRRAKTNKSALEDESSASEAEAGFHFVAYMPIGDHVWKLDGMDHFPTNIGKNQRDDDWLSLVQTVLSVRMAEYEEGQLQFSLMAVVQDPIIEARQNLAKNIRYLQETQLKLTKLFQNDHEWRNFIPSDSSKIETLFGPSEKYGVSQKSITTAIPTGTHTLETFFQKHLASGDGDSTESRQSSLLRLRQELIRDQAGCRASVRDSQQAEKSDCEESMHRRHDYTSFVKAWLQALVDNGALSSLLEKS